MEAYQDEDYIGHIIINEKLSALEDIFKEKIEGWTMRNKFYILRSVVST